MSEPTRTALDVLTSELVPLKGKKLLDIGCGKGGLRSPLEKLGVSWRGLDPVVASPDLPIDIAPAEAMPYADDSYDAAIFVNALHHVPAAAMGAALRETARVLRPDGCLVVIEPRATGALSQIIAVVDDETYIRMAAQGAMDQTRSLKQISAYDYPRIERFAGFDVFCETLIAVDPTRRAQINARREHLRRSFEKYAGCDGENWTLSQPMSVRVFHPI